MRGRSEGRATVGLAVQMLIMGASAMTVSAFTSPAPASTPASGYPAMAPQSAYAMPHDDEAVLARTAAPASVSKDATVLVLDAGGYVQAVKGSNGFVCLVERSWNADFADAGFWNPKVRAPICYNASAAASVLPEYLDRTSMALRGAARDAIKEASGAKVERPTVSPGAMSYMMSRSGYLSDVAGHAHPHLMFYFDDLDPAKWGANLEGSPVAGFAGGNHLPTVFFVSVTHWSDGSSAMAM